MELGCRIIYWFLFCIGVPGNIIITAAYAIKAKKKSTDILILIQALVDLIACITPQPDMINDVSSCLVTAVIRMTTSLGSLFLTFAIALDRFVTVCRPFSRQMTRTSATVLALACLGFAFLLNLPSVWYFNLLDLGSKGCMSVVTSPLHVPVKVILVVSFSVAVAVSLFSYTKIYTLIRRQSRVRSEMGVDLRSQSGPYRSSTMPTISGSVTESLQRTRIAWNGNETSTNGRSTLVSCNLESQDSGYLEVPSLMKPGTGTSDQRSSKIDVPIVESVEVSGSTGEAQDQTPSLVNNNGKQLQSNAKPNRVPGRAHGDKTTKMLLAITVFLIVTWLPYVVVFSLPTATYFYLVTEITNKHVVYFITRIRGFNHMINAFIYWTVNPHFRDDVQKIFIRLKNLTKR
ncbi:uncharacterized protein LOC129276060 [Lytechinus pictus]|uniref:uncharacterized protein LOC129276060 n=1 Tax=Lytechinus pictus TaxID=7653 RepID=UPI0030B9D29D